MLFAPSPKVTHHAIRQYRARVLACPERHRTDEAISQTIKAQVLAGAWECAGGETFQIKCGSMLPKSSKPWEMKVVNVTYRFIIECQTVVTVLGFMMRPNPRAVQRRRRRQRLAKMQASQA